MEEVLIWMTRKQYDLIYEISRQYGLLIEDMFLYLIEFQVCTMESMDSDHSFRIVDWGGEIYEPVRVPVFLFNRVRKLMSGIPESVISDGNIAINTFLHRMISYLEYAQEENDSIEKTASELMKLNDGQDRCVWMGTTNYRWELAPG